MRWIFEIVGEILWLVIWWIKAEQWKTLVPPSESNRTCLCGDRSISPSAQSVLELTWFFKPMKSSTKDVSLVGPCFQDNSRNAIFSFCFLQTRRRGSWRNENGIRNVFLIFYLYLMSLRFNSHAFFSFLFSIF
jgi:hypothetical protein